MALSCRRSLAERLIKGRILLPDDPGLLDGVPQSWRVRRPDHGAAMIALDALADVARWVAWRNEKRGKEGKPTKVPYGRGGKPAKADDETTWLVRAEAEDLARRIVNGQGGGLGYELGDIGNDLFVAGIDLDCCLQDGALAPWAAAILDAAGTYAEICPAAAESSCSSISPPRMSAGFSTASGFRQPAGAAAAAFPAKTPATTARRSRSIARPAISPSPRTAGPARPIASGCWIAHDLDGSLGWCRRPRQPADRQERARR